MIQVEQQQQQVLLEQILQQMVTMNQRIDGMNNNIQQQLMTTNQRIDGLAQQNLHLLQAMAAFNWTVAEKNAMYKSINRQLDLDEPLHILWISSNKNTFK